MLGVVVPPPCELEPHLCAGVASQSGYFGSRLVVVRLYKLDLEGVLSHSASQGLVRPLVTFDKACESG